MMQNDEKHLSQCWGRWVKAELRYSGPRERKKAKDGKSYLNKENERVKTYYKPTTDIGPNKLRIRRERIRKCMQRLRQRQREAHDDQESQAVE
ncbi:hypothetical protein ACF0H5_016800 [Mactra antiquata]